MADFFFGLLAGGDFFTGAGLLSVFPPLMWAFSGLILGASLAFWLEAPIYGLRKQRPFILAAPLLLLGILAFVIYPRRPLPSLAAPVAPPPPPIPAPNFGGTWDTGKWGTMSFTQDGEHVFGTYTYSDGVIEGTVTDAGGGMSTLRYRWRNQSGGQSGVGYFTLSADARSFVGKWTQGDNLSSGAGQDWDGTRIANATPPPNFTGLWNTEWGAMKLNQGVKRVTGTYAYGGGLIEGELQGKNLDFRWTNRVTGETGTGKFTLELYGNAFVGTWGSQGSSTNGGAWTGHR